MKKILIVCVMACASLCVAEQKQPDKPQPNQPKHLKVLMIGNSFSIQMVYELPKVAKGLGLGLDIASMYIGGCSLEQHAKNAAQTGAHQYSYEWNYCGIQHKSDAPAAKANQSYETTDPKTQKVTKHYGANIPAALLADRWDVVTIQQASHYSWQPKTYHPWGDDLVKVIRQFAPQAKIVVQETWSYTPWDGRLAKWGIDQNEMYEKLRDAYGDFARRYGFDILPVGTAVQAWRKQLPVKYTENSMGGDVCGVDRFKQDANGMWVPQGDRFHFNANGNYLQALVWAAKLYNVDVTACTYEPNQLKGEKAQLMKKIAMEVVK